MKTKQGGANRGTSLRFLARFLDKVAMKWVYPFRRLSRNKIPLLSRARALLQFTEIDVQLRDERVDKALEKTESCTLLDVGSGGYSPFTSPEVYVTSIDLYAKKGVDIIADARWLPLRSLSFDYVASVDCVEHIPKENRILALLEMIRIAKRKVVIHTPVHDGKLFLGRAYDELFLSLHRKIFSRNMRQTTEHLEAKHPSPTDFTSLGFTISGVNNVHVWVLHMIIYRIPIVKILAWPLYLFFLKYFDNKPPYWGIVATLTKP